MRHVPSSLHPREQQLELSSGDVTVLVTCICRKRVGSSGIKWDHVGSCGIKWDHVGSSGINSDFVGAVWSDFEVTMQYGANFNF